MRKYRKVTKTYETDEIEECVCDKCGKKCEKVHEDNCDVDKRTYIKIQPMYSGDENICLDLCPECTRKLLDWFHRNEEIEDFKQTLDIWEEDD